MRRRPPSGGDAIELAEIYTRANQGIDAPLVSVQVHLSSGLPAFTIVGLPETAVKESKERVRSALINSHFEFPTRRITVNLAPAELPKEGGRYDLAIAIGILAASDQIPASTLPEYEFIGELSLSGNLRAVGAILPAAIACGARGKRLWVAEQRRGRRAGRRSVRFTSGAPAEHFRSPVRPRKSSSMAAMPRSHNARRQFPRRGDWPATGQAGTGNRCLRRPSSTFFWAARNR